MCVVERVRVSGRWCELAVWRFPTRGHAEAWYLRRKKEFPDRAYRLA